MFLHVKIVLKLKESSPISKTVSRLLIATLLNNKLYSILLDCILYVYWLYVVCLVILYCIFIYYIKGNNLLPDHRKWSRAHRFLSCTAHVGSGRWLSSLFSVSLWCFPAAGIHLDISFKVCSSLWYFLIL